MLSQWWKRLVGQKALASSMLLKKVRESAGNIGICPVCGNICQNSIKYSEKTWHFRCECGRVFRIHDITELVAKIEKNTYKMVADKLPEIMEEAHKQEDKDE